MLNSFISDKPKQVALAVNLLWATQALSIPGIIISALAYENFVDTSIFIAFCFFILLLNGFLIFKISQKKNWARVLTLVFIALSIPFYTKNIYNFFNESLFNGSVYLIQFVLQLSVLFLLARPNMAHWFKDGQS